MSIVLDGTAGITTPNVASTTSTLGPLTQALNLGSTGQIVFPATQNASSNANTLDDYEEGTFTPNTFAAGYTADLVSGFYTKVGRVVTLSVNVRFSAVPSNNSAVTFFGAPFASGIANAGTCCAGVIRENSATGAVYGLNIQNNGQTILEINSMDGVGTGSQRTIRVNEMYCGMLTYFTS